MSNHPNRSKSIQFAVIQVGQCVFGAGHTEGSAIYDACRWLEPDPDNGKYTPTKLRNELDDSSRRVDGDLALIDADDPEFSSYLRNQGGYEQRRGKWFPA